ncbi:type II secretion system F family protein [Halegenticoccus tardaugens]|uniref:type II secretion system F family protein n=1 Tax=Halegenticoccus tardaugens TaxID=2071624 RepID=UPI00100C1D10|nr:type II secretion system F family protein [Halegenticoccus tardaugens]
MLRWLPLAFAVGLVMLAICDRYVPRVRLAASRVALAAFGEYVAAGGSRTNRQRGRLRAAHVGTTHRLYAARALLFSGLFGLAGSLFGAYLAAWGLRTLAVSEESIRRALPEALGFVAGVARIPDLAAGELFVLLLCSSATVGGGLAVGCYWAHWALLDQRTAARAGRIESTLPRTVAFVYALSRSGTTLPRVLSTLAANRRAYGEAAEEFAVAVREMNALGTDAPTALSRMARRTPSDELAEFAENLASVLGSGRSLSSFLRARYDRYAEEAEARQEQYLELLSVLAEVYVTALVAGPLFLVTVLAVIGLVLSDTLSFLRFVVYAALPLATAGFVVYVDSVTGPLGGSEGAGGEAEDVGGDVGDGDWNGSVRSVAVADGGRSFEVGDRTVGTDGDGADESDRDRANRRRLAAYDRTRPIRRWLSDPLGSVRRRPVATFAGTVPLGVLWTILRVDPPESASLGAAIAAFDGPAVGAAAFALGAFALVYELEKRRVRAIEAAVPDFLGRLAGVNEAGLSVVESVERVSRSELGALTPEVVRARRDVAWGADVETALRRMDRRIGSRAVSRAVTLVANAMRASGDIAPVLRIAADEAQTNRRLRTARRGEMVTYLVVIYLAFLVFLAVVAALTVAFVPAVEAAQASAGEGAGAAVGSPVGGVADADTGAYSLVFFHVTVVQAVCSGFVAGQLGEGRVADGAKHATALLCVATVAFALL